VQVEEDEDDDEFRKYGKEVLELEHAHTIYTTKSPFSPLRNIFLLFIFGLNHASIFIFLFFLPFFFLLIKFWKKNYNVIFHIWEFEFLPFIIFPFIINLER
jgi:hypothetical protein